MVTLPAQVCLAETRGEAVVRPAADARIADLPAGHWATNATQVVLANNIMKLDDTGKFNGNRLLSATELVGVMDGLVMTAENIAGKGPNPSLRAAIAGLTPSDEAISRLRLSQVLANFLDVTATDGLVALAAPTHDASRFKDLGASVPSAVSAVVDKFKVMTGYPDNTFRPDDAVTRYQMAAIAFNVLNAMRMAPIAQLPIVVPGPAPTPTIVYVPTEPTPAPAVSSAPAQRENFRARVPFHLNYQAVNSNNLTNGNPFSVIPLEGQITAYQGPVMLQNQTDVRVDVARSNNIDTEFRLGYDGLKYGMVQLIPYVGAHIGLSTSAPAPGTNIQYDSYVGPAYGAILSIMPTNAIDLHAHFGQSPLLAAGRFNSNFQTVAYPNAVGSLLSAYGVGADFYVATNICVSVGLDTWQDPASLNTGGLTDASGVINTFGGSVGVGSSF